MRLFRRLFFIVLGAMALVHGIENFRVNDVPKTFTMEEVERKGVGDARYIIVTGAESTGRYSLIKSYWTHDPNNKFTSGVILPLYSRGRLAEAEAENEKRPLARLLYADDDDEVPLPTSLVYKEGGYKGCVVDDTCGKAGPVEVRGVVKSGSLTLLKSDDYANHYPHAANFIYVDAGEPIPKPVCLALFVVGVVLLVLALMPRRKFDKHVTGVYR